MISKSFIPILLILFTSNVYSQKDSTTIVQEGEKVFKNNLIINLGLYRVGSVVSADYGAKLRMNASYVYNPNKNVGLGVRLEYFARRNQSFIPIAFIVRSTLMQKTSKHAYKTTINFNTAVGYSFANSATSEDGNTWGGGYIYFGLENVFSIGNRWEVLFTFDYTLQFYKYTVYQEYYNYDETRNFFLFGFQLGVNYRL